ncbi:unnamed protein product [Acanthoscelides obtectus]|uniref:Uncharacterized protein n=1 Tax=Acanthoscelides obtectus TaxID=200917 RepID=A0A9P0P6S8_ACAOB|nr:unnamed protein product [Acanthoscelides obtectus]CAK1666494.1 hypothetical protein AOBTE_LOCUS25354 [Acanthoscelides obtectus]
MPHVVSFKATSIWAKWKRHRKVITPSFNQRVLDSFVVLFNEKETSMGVELDVESLERRLDEVLDKQIHLFTEKTLILWNHFEVIWYLSGKKKMYQDYINRFGSIISEVANLSMLLSLLEPAGKIMLNYNLIY